jgi:hypothetical protein
MATMVPQATTMSLATGTSYTLPSPSPQGKGEEIEFNVVKLIVTTQPL